MFDLVIHGQNAHLFRSQIQGVTVWEKDNALRVCQLSFEDAIEIQERAQKAQLDANLVKSGLSIKEIHVAAFDMDSTHIDLECIDDIAMQIGVGEKVSQMTELAMQGHFEFADFLRQRSHLLKGGTRDVINTTVSHATLMPGALRLMNFLKENGVKTYIISGGFSDIARDVCERLGMNNYLCNELVFDKEDKLSGEVTGPAGGEIIDAAGKRNALAVLCMLNHTKLSNAIAVGDGANDLKMLGAAKIGVAYHAKPIVRDAAHYHIEFGGLDVIIDFFVEAWSQK